MTNNQNINDLIISCGGLCDFRDVVMLENCKVKEEFLIRKRMAERHRQNKIYRLRKKHL